MPFETHELARSTVASHNFKYMSHKTVVSDNVEFRSVTRGVVTYIG